MDVISDRSLRRDGLGASCDGWESAEALEGDAAYTFLVRAHGPVNRWGGNDSEEFLPGPSFPSGAALMRALTTPAAVLASGGLMRCALRHDHRDGSSGRRAWI